MYHHIFAANSSNEYDVAILCKNNSFSKNELIKYYVKPLNDLGVPYEKIIAMTVACQGKTPKASEVKEFLPQLEKTITSLKIKYLLITDGTYFKKICMESKADVHLGYLKETIFEGVQGTLGINYLQIMFDSIHAERSQRALQVIGDAYNGSYTEIGKDIIKSAAYPKTVSEIKERLSSLHLFNELTVDIEAFSLNIHKAGIGTIAFAWDKHNGIAFPVDYKPKMMPIGGVFGYKEHNHEVRDLLREFFSTYKGKLIAHNASYDFKVLIYNLFMKDAADVVGMKDALDLIHHKIEDTKLIAYVSLNSTEDYKVGLKPLSHEFAGNYGQDNIHDITLIQLDELLEYNLKDCLCTWFVYDKYVPIMRQDAQEDVYRNFFLPSLKVVLEMEIWGLPVKSERVERVEIELNEQLDKQLLIIQSSPYLQEAEDRLIAQHMDARNAELKKKQLTFLDAAKEFGDFNLNSNPQLQFLLYEVMDYTIIDYTKSKQPATGKKTIEKLMHLEVDPHKKEFLKALMVYSAIEKIRSSFLPAFKAAYPKSDGRSYINGSFNLGATISGRLSSSDPNMQNLPSGSSYGKPIKSQVIAPKGWIFGGADYNALEDRVNTILTNDPNKVKIYKDGYDGHCFRAFYYWGDQMPDIVNTVESINSIETKYPKLRQRGKSPSFALQYAGTWLTLMKNCGFSEDEARKVEANYHKMYIASLEFTKKRLELVRKNGYAELAFGLKLRSPLLTKTKLGTKSTPRQAEADARSLGNAIGGQSYCMLNNFSSHLFMQRVKTSEYRYDIIPVSWIHDAQYYVFRDDIKTVKWVNDNLIECMEQNVLPELEHPDIKLGANLDLYYPSWEYPLTLPNRASEQEIQALVAKHLNALYEKGVPLS